MKKLLLALALILIPFSAQADTVEWTEYGANSPWSHGIQLYSITKITVDGTECVVFATRHNNGNYEGGGIDCNFSTQSGTITQNGAILNFKERKNRR